MANTTYLKTVERHIADWLSVKIGVPLAPRRVIVGPRTDGTPVHFEFDGVSHDGTVGVLVSTSHTIKPGGIRKLHQDASILLNASFERRIMVFLRDDVRQNFLNKCDGLLPLSRIEMLVCEDLPAEMAAEIALIQSAAKSETGDKGKVWRVGGARR